MKYFVTYCATDEKVKSNPMWHSCFLLSTADETEQLMKVNETWSFYGVPTTTPGSSFLKKIKLQFGLDVDLVGNHGVLRHEEVRYFDAGVGLHAVTFKVTEEQYTTLQTNARQMEKDQQQAIAEVVDTQKLRGKPQEETRIYPQEQYSKIIYDLELIKAAQDGRPSRLKEFRLRPSIGLWGPNMGSSRTCKSQVIELLATVLSESQIARLTENGKHPTIPRFSGPMEKIYLHSVGPLRQHTTHSGDKLYYRNANDAGVELHWTLPPQEIEADEETMQRFKIEEPYCHEVKSLVSKLQQLEWVFRNAKLPEEFNEVRKRLVDEIINSYTEFFDIQPKPKKIDERSRSWLDRMFFSTPQPYYADLQEKIELSKMLLNSLYMAAVDNWTLDLSRPFEDDLVDETTETESQDRYTNPYEALAAYLSEVDKKKMCSILGRTYCVNEPEDQVEESPKVLRAAR